MELVKFRVNCRNLTDNINYGNFDIVTPQFDDINETEWHLEINSFNTPADVPRCQELIRMMGLNKVPTLFLPNITVYPADGYPPIDNFSFSGASIAGFPVKLGDRDNPREITYEFKFIGDTSGGSIRVKTHSTDTAIRFESPIYSICKNGTALYSADFPMSSGWGTQWGIYRLSLGCSFFPMITRNKDAVSVGMYYCWVEDKLVLEPNPEMRQSGAYGTPSNANGVVQAWLQAFENWEPDYYDDDNPYEYGGTSEEAGGNGNFSEKSDNPEADELPGIDAIGTGFATIFKPSKNQLRNLSELFWNSNVFTFLQNLVENITDMFTSLAMVPFDVEAGNTVSVTWLGIDTAVSLTLAAKQYYEFNMGSIDLSSDSRIFTSGSALDYSPFSTLGIYLPFIGYQELDIDECRGAIINLRYRIDILSGACVAIIKVAGRDIYQFTGNCLTQIPITNENMQSLVTDAINVGIAAAGRQASKGTMNAVEEQIGKSTISAERKEVAMSHASENLGHSQSRLVSATANLMASGKPSFNKTGAVSSAASMMSVKQPYLFLSTPRQSIPKHYQRYCGFPSNITGKLGDFSGYTVVENIRLNDLVATSLEVSEIYKLLKSGVII